MIFSQYNIYCMENCDTIVFNTINRKLMKIPTNLLSKYQDSTIIQKLLADFLITSPDEDIHNLNYLMNSMIYQTTRLSITLMMTLNCNFKCVYCFESWLPSELRLCTLDENKIIDWIKILIKKYHFKEVDICFHGGEPLLETKKILYIAETLRSFFIKNNIFYLFTAVSNGYLLSKKVIETLYTLDIKIVQITIDGLREIRDQRRPLKNGQGTFLNIINNIKNNDRLRIYINIVYDIQNYISVYNLIDFFSKNNMQQNIDLIILNATKPIYGKDLLDNKPLHHEKEAKVRIDLLNYSTREGFKVPFDIDYQVCTLKQKSSFVLTPDHNVYKCISGIGCEFFKLCEFDIDIDPLEKQAHIIETSKNTDCKNCKYMPICNGYCMYENYVHNFKTKQCNKKFFDIYIPKFLKLYLNSGHKNNFILNKSVDMWSYHYILPEANGKLIVNINCLFLIIFGNF